MPVPIPGDAARPMDRSAAVAMAGFTGRAMASPDRGFGPNPADASCRGRARPVSHGPERDPAGRLGVHVAIAVLAAAGAEMTIPAWLPIPGDIYYPVETVFIGPLTVVLWLVAGWLAHRLAGLAVGRGTLRTTAGMLAVAIAISSLPTRVPDLVTGVLFLTGILPRGEWLEMTSGGFWQGVDIGYLALYLIGFAVLFPAAIRVGEGVSRRAAAAIGLLSFAACQVPYLIAVR